MEWERFIARLVELGWLGVLGAFGGLANYVYLSMRKQTPFNWKRFLANLFLAVFTGIMLGQFISPENPFRDGFIMAFGFCAYPLLNLVEDWIIQFAKSKLPQK